MASGSNTATMTPMIALTAISRSPRPSTWATYLIGPRSASVRLRSTHLGALNPDVGQLAGGRLALAVVGDRPQRPAGRSTTGPKRLATARRSREPAQSVSAAGQR